MSLSDLCYVCGVNPIRVLPDPIPEGHLVMFTESIAGKALYCETCFDSQEEE